MFRRVRWVSFSTFGVGVAAAALVAAIVPLNGVAAPATSPPSSGLAAVTAPVAALPQLLKNTVPKIVASALKLGEVAASTPLMVIAPLTLPHQSAITTYIDSEYSSTSPNYHHFLTPSAFADYFPAPPRRTRPHRDPDPVLPRLCRRSRGVEPPLREVQRRSGPDPAHLRHRHRPPPAARGALHLRLQRHQPRHSRQTERAHFRSHRPRQPRRAARQPRHSHPCRGRTRQGEHLADHPRHRGRRRGDALRGSHRRRRLHGPAAGCGLRLQRAVLPGIPRAGHDGLAGRVRRLPRLERGHPAALLRRQGHVGEPGPGRRPHLGASRRRRGRGHARHRGHARDAAPTGQSRRLRGPDHRHGRDRPVQRLRDQRRLAGALVELGQLRGARQPVRCHPLQHRRPRKPPPRASRSSMRPATPEPSTAGATRRQPAAASAWRPKGRRPT